MQNTLQDVRFGMLLFGFKRKNVRHTHKYIPVYDRKSLKRKKRNQYQWWASGWGLWGLRSQGGIGVYFPLNTLNLCAWRTGDAYKYLMIEGKEKKVFLFESVF